MHVCRCSVPFARPERISRPFIQHKAIRGFSSDIGAQIAPRHDNRPALRAPRAIRRMREIDCLASSDERTWAGLLRLHVCIVQLSTDSRTCILKPFAEVIINVACRITRCRDLSYGIAECSPLRERQTGEKYKSCAGALYLPSSPGGLFLSLQLRSSTASWRPRYSLQEPSQHFRMCRLQHPLLAVSHALLLISLVSQKAPWPLVPHEKV